MKTIPFYDYYTFYYRTVPYDEPVTMNYNNRKNRRNYQLVTDYFDSTDIILE